MGNNTGIENSGDRNSGNWNSGDWNSGNRNSGNRNSGYWNSGYGNSGDWNSGNWNSGDRNSGNWNSGNRNSGIFNSDEPNVRAFNKETNIKYSDWLNSDDYIYFDIPLNVYVWYSDMTEQEKKDHDYAKNTGGYLKTLGYKEAWAEWYKDNQDKKEKIKNLPNFDADIFEQITGIKIEEEKKEEVIEELTLEEICKQLGKNIKIIK